MPAVLTELMARDGNNNSNNNNNRSSGDNKSSKGRGNIFNRRMKDEQRGNGLLQPMLSGQQRLLGSSEGDINQNMNLSSASSPSLLVVVDGNNNNNNNSNSNDDLESSATGRDGEDEDEEERQRRVNMSVDRRKSSVEPMQRHQLLQQEESSGELERRRRKMQDEGGFENGLGAEEDFEDIDGSSQEVSGAEDGLESVEDLGAEANSSGVYNEISLKHRPPSTPVSVCSSNC